MKTILVLSLVFAASQGFSNSSVLTNFKPHSPNKIRVLVVDTGVDSQHLDLINFLDKKASDSASLTDPHGHGTHIASLIAKDACSKLEIISCRYSSTDGKVSESNACLKKALDEKVDIVNYSGGGPLPDDTEKELIAQLEKAGTLVVAALGNDGANADSPFYKYYPAMYLNSNVIAVGNLQELETFSTKQTAKNLLKPYPCVPPTDWDSKTTLTCINPYSNWAKKAVWELGTNIKAASGRFPASKEAHGGETLMTGTSQAAAIHTNRIIKELCEKD